MKITGIKATTNTTLLEAPLCYANDSHCWSRFVRTIVDDPSTLFIASSRFGMHESELVGHQDGGLFALEVGVRPANRFRLAKSWERNQSLRSHSER